MSRWPGPQGIVGAVQRILSDGVPSVTTDALSIGSAHEHAKPKDGTDGIQTAYNNLPSGGGLITLSAGRYEASAGHQFPDTLLKIDDPNKPVAIIGQGYESEIFVPANYQDNDSDGMRIIDIGGNTNDPWISNSDVYVDGCLFRDFRINANQQNNNGEGDGNTLTGANDGHNIEVYGSDNKFIGIWPNNATGDGIEITRDDGSAETDTEANLVLGCTFRDCWEQNVHIHGGTNTVVSNNWMLGEVNNACLHLFNDDNAETTRAIIDGNFIFDSDVAGAKLTGSDTGDKNPDANEILFTNNFVWGHGSEGILVDSRNIFDLTIRGNRIFSNAGSGIRVAFGADDLRIVDNEIYLNDGDGIGLKAEVDGSGVGGALDGVVIERNEIRENDQLDNFGMGIRVTADGENITNLFIRDNDILGDGSGAGAHRAPLNFVETSAGGTYTNIRVERNTESGNTNSGFQNQQLTLAAIKDNSPPIAVDVRNLSADSDERAVHDGSGPGEAGKAHYDGSNWFYENGVTESANAETPQGTYPAGQIVYFTDSGDGSGTGTYIIDDGGAAQGPL